MAAQRPDGMQRGAARENLGRARDRTPVQGGHRCASNTGAREALGKTGPAC
eukprot:CAMPEP_0179202244 /NCGR_PEP_ID=MMETSP0796-20121207/100727_1 /TAXON_ID=73915 /ORGANISM="Pyrodinium bahamense, Strain pbaha01" /LENGTH=50 /DNA_ID=CAMNT_0020906943 /DNA_START=40 /DNA_END=192 /DNA_ORIENTATION=-